MGKRILRLLNGCLVSYGTVIVIYLVFSQVGWYGPLDGEIAWQLLAICLAVAVLQYFVDFLPLHSKTLQALCYFAAMCAVVVGLGSGVFHLFSLQWKVILILGLMLGLVYLVTFALSYYADYQEAKHINEMIEKKRK